MQHFPKTNAFIIGNGLSRQGIDLSDLPGAIFGCNALYRDYTPDYLVAVDKKMQEEILAAGYKGLCIFKTARGLTYPPNIIESDKQISSPNNSGVTALWYALKYGYKPVYLLGMDFNSANVYAGTKNYERHKQKPPKVTREVWEKVAEFSKKNEIYRVFHPDYSTERDGINDITYDEFRQRFNLS